MEECDDVGSVDGLVGGVLDEGGAEPCPIGVYFNFARHTREPYRKMGSPIGHVWWLTRVQQSVLPAELANLASKIYIVCYKPFGGRQDRRRST